MNYENKYLKYKNKYLQLRQELISQGVDVDQYMNENLKNLNIQSGGGDNDIFVSNQELTELKLSELNLTETPNIFDQEGGYVAPRPGTGDAPPIPGRSEPGDGGIPYAISPSSPPRPLLPKPPPAPAPAPPAPAPAPPAPAPSSQKTTTTNVRNVYNYFDPLYPSYTVPAYNTVVTSAPLFTVPKNTFPILRSNNDFYSDDYDEPTPRRRSKKKSSRKSSKRKSSKRKSSKRKSSKRKSSKRKSS